MVQKKVPWLLKRETKHELVKCTKFLQCLSRESTGEGDQWDSKSQIHTVLVNVSRHCTAACVCLCVFYICPQAETERWHLTTVLKGRGGRWFPQWAWKAAMFVLHCLQKWNRHAKKKKKTEKLGPVWVRVCRKPASDLTLSRERRDKDDHCRGRKN